jgi:hypothetical protein
MKFATTLLLLSSLIVALPSEDKKGDSTSQPTCVHIVQCKIEELKKDKDNEKSLEACDFMSEENDKSKCTLEALGLESEQVDQFIKLDKFITKCTQNSNATFTKCTEKCEKEKKKDECINKCKESNIDEIGKCTTKIAEKSDFDIKKSAKCSNGCTEKTLSEVFKCDYKCNKALYDALLTKSSEDNLTEKDNKDGKDDKAKEEKTKEDKSKEEKTKEEKSKEDKDKTGSSSAMTNFGTDSFGAIAIGTILSTLII